MRTMIPAFVLGLALLVGGLAWAGDEAPTASPAVAAKEAPATPTKPATATPSPIHTMMKWVGSHVVADGSPCPTTEKGESAWRTWFSGDKDIPLAGLRDAMVKDGWNADRTIGFFKTMAAKAGSECSSSNCDKSGDCASKCDKSGDRASKCDKSGDCASKCDKSGDRASKCGKDGSCCGTCDKAADCPSKCDKGSKKVSDGTSSPTSDAAPASKAGESKPSCGDGPCPCTGKPKAECPGCDKAGCSCGKTTAPATKG